MSCTRLLVPIVCCLAGCAGQGVDQSARQALIIYHAATGTAEAPMPFSLSFASSSSQLKETPFQVSVSRGRPLEIGSGNHQPSSQSRLVSDATMRDLIQFINESLVPWLDQQVEPDSNQRVPRSLEVKTADGVLLIRKDTLPEGGRRLFTQFERFLLALSQRSASGRP